MKPKISFSTVLRYFFGLLQDFFDKSHRIISDIQFHSPAQKNISLPPFHGSLRVREKTPSGMKRKFSSYKISRQKAFQSFFDRCCCSSSYWKDFEGLGVCQLAASNQLWTWWWVFFLFEEIMFCNSFWYYSLCTDLSTIKRMKKCYSPFIRIQDICK